MVKPSYEELEQLVSKQDQEIQSWQTASGLVGDGGYGDPSSIRPQDLEKYVSALERCDTALELIMEHVLSNPQPYGDDRYVFPHNEFATAPRYIIDMAHKAIDKLPKTTP